MEINLIVTVSRIEILLCYVIGILAAIRTYRTLPGIPDGGQLFLRRNLSIWSKLICVILLVSFEMLSITIVPVALECFKLDRRYLAQLEIYRPFTNCVLANLPASQWYMRRVWKLIHVWKCRFIVVVVI
jgi:hypothetical protein